MKNPHFVPESSLVSPLSFCWYTALYQLSIQCGSSVYSSRRSGSAPKSPAEPWDAELWLTHLLYPVPPQNTWANVYYSDLIESPQQGVVIIVGLRGKLSHDTQYWKPPTWNVYTFSKLLFFQIGQINKAIQGKEKKNPSFLHKSLMIALFKLSKSWPYLSRQTVHLAFGSQTAWSQPRRVCTASSCPLGELSWTRLTHNQGKSCFHRKEGTWCHPPALRSSAAVQHHLEVSLDGQ